MTDRASEDGAPSGTALEATSEATYEGASRIGAGHAPRPAGDAAPEEVTTPAAVTPPRGGSSDAPAATLAKARPRGLNRLSMLRNFLVGLRRKWCVRVWGMDIHPTAQMSLSAKLDRTFPIGVHVGEHSYLAFESRILTHDVTRGLYLHTRVGRNCFIGGRSTILPGVEIGDGCVVGVGAVVTRSVPAGSVVAGNPARVLRSGVDVGRYGRFAQADATEAALVEAGVV